MPARTTSDQVKQVLAPGNDYDTRRNPSLTPFIDTASVMVDDMVEAAAEDGITYSAAKLELIERWVAAHAYKCSDKDFTSRTTAGASGTFAGQVGMGLEATLYGQMALRLDNHGYLLASQSGGIPEAGGCWLGKNPRDQREYGE